MDTQQQESYKVLVIGDSCVDVYVHGDVNRISPEAPVPIIDIKRTELKKGMAANVNANLIALGMTTTFKTNNEKIYKTRFIDDATNHHMLRVDDESKLEPFMERLSGQYDAIVISDYNKGFVTHSVIKTILKEFPDTPVFIDTKKTDIDYLFDVENWYIKINKLEANKLIGLPKNTPKNMIVTLGKEGTLRDGKVFQQTKVEVFDVCGAGDTFLAALCYGYLETGDIDVAIMFANKVAAVTVQHPGVYVPTKEDLRRII